MAATVLNSPEAVAMSVFVVRAFMQMREHLVANAAILKRLAEIDKTLLKHDSELRTIWSISSEKKLPEKVLDRFPCLRSAWMGRSMGLGSGEEPSEKAGNEAKSFYHRAMRLAGGRQPLRADAPAEYKHGCICFRPARPDDFGGEDRTIEPAFDGF